VTCTGAPTLDGYMDNGTMCGYAWTAQNKTAAGAEIAGQTIEPPCGTGGVCFTGSTICATGSIPANDAASEIYSGIMIGWNVAQASGATTSSTYAATGTGITVNYTATGATGQVRVILKAGSAEYCAPATSGVAIPWSSFKTECWGTTGTALPSGAAISQLMVQINGSDTAAQTVTNFCIDSVTNN
jgi:hypothetical protein